MTSMFFRLCLVPLILSVMFLGGCSGGSPPPGRPSEIASGLPHAAQCHHAVARAVERAIGGVGWIQALVQPQTVQLPQVAVLAIVYIEVAVAAETQLRAASATPPLAAEAAIVLAEVALLRPIDHSVATQSTIHPSVEGADRHAGCARAIPPRFGQAMG